MIYGFDQEEQVFYLAGFNRDGQFGTQKISYGAFLKAINYKSTITQNLDMYMVLFKRKNLKYDPRLDIIGKKLNDYITSKNASVNDLQYKPVMDDMTWGLDVYDKMIEIKNDVFYNRRIMEVLFEHKYCMRERIRYIKALGLPVSDQLISDYEAVANQVLLLRNVRMKYHLQNRKEKFEDMLCSVLPAIKSDEERILSHLYNIILSGVRGQA